ncbi:hypothetical protein [Clostridium magnum]|uniref:Uncharacterized protein n=1 Tax=Clostridium magnum DSM 2767 TaxID=1121326 RepID=A0A162QLI3_9CLOT|nr:hypothetical protein [Clostridium magnum]KZL88675.1 hypothetical protein CLMAG_59640 [Clostridium magnum DSM 2767]SHJ60654.1 hypothetical protein SAMN02745944_06225 [Clostridium magnum DSM 2767]
MLKDIIITVLVSQGFIGTVLAYKNYKELRELKTKINKSTGIAQEVKVTVDSAGKNISEEIRKQIYNLSFMGIKMK